jgi:hypothetical protein
MSTINNGELSDDGEPDDLKKVNEFTSGTLKGIGVKRKVFSRMFYVYPAEGEEKPKADAKPKGDEKAKADGKKTGKK